jgi:hypothetical protein
MNLGARPSEHHIVLHVEKIVSMMQQAYADAAMIDHSGKFSSVNSVKKSISDVRSALKDMERDLKLRALAIRKLKQGMGQVDEFDEPIDDPMES